MIGKLLGFVFKMNEVLEGGEECHKTSGVLCESHTDFRAHTYYKRKMNIFFF